MSTSDKKIGGMDSKSRRGKRDKSSHSSSAAASASNESISHICASPSPAVDEARSKSELRRQRILEKSGERMGVASRPAADEAQNEQEMIPSASSRMQAMRSRRFKKKDPNSESEKDPKPKAVARAPPMCRFFALNGDCRYGEDCRFSHSLPEGGIMEARKQIPCRFYLQVCNI